jgi:hypothetical protein
MMRQLLFAVLACCAAVPAVAQQVQEDSTVETIPRQIAVLQGLDKITARISTFEAPLDTIVQFNSLEIMVRACEVTPPEATPEAAAFLEIDDRQPDRPIQRLFTGWMFASSPAVSALEHPVYDVWVKGCRDPE